MNGVYSDIIFKHSQTNKQTNKNKKGRRAQYNGIERKFEDDNLKLFIQPGNTANDWIPLIRLNPDKIQTSNLKHGTLGPDLHTRFLNCIH